MIPAGARYFRASVLIVLIVELLLTDWHLSPKRALFFATLYFLSSFVQDLVFGSLGFRMTKPARRRDPVSDQVFVAGSFESPEEEVGEERALLDHVLNPGRMIALRVAAMALIVIYGVIVARGWLPHHTVSLFHLAIACTLVSVASLNHYWIPIFLSATAVLYSLQSGETGSSLFLALYLAAFMGSLGVFRVAEVSTAQAIGKQPFEWKSQFKRLAAVSLLFSCVFLALCWGVNTVLPKSKPGEEQSKSSQGSSTVASGASPAGLEALQGLNKAAGKIAHRLSRSPESHSKSDFDPDTGPAFDLASKPAFDSNTSFGQPTIPGSGERILSDQSAIEYEKKFCEALSAQGETPDSDAELRKVIGELREAVAPPAPEVREARPSTALEIQNSDGTRKTIEVPTSVAKALRKIGEQSSSPQSRERPQLSTIAKGTASGAGAGAGSGAGVGAGAPSVSVHEISFEPSRGGSASLGEIAGEGNAGLVEAPREGSASPAPVPAASYKLDPRLINALNAAYEKVPPPNPSNGGRGADTSYERYLRQGQYANIRREEAPTREENAPKEESRPLLDEKQLQLLYSALRALLAIAALAMVGVLLWKLLYRGDPNKPRKVKLMRGTRLALKEELRALEDRKLTAYEEVIARYKIFLSIMDAVQRPKPEHLPPNEYYQVLACEFPHLVSHTQRITTVFSDSFYVEIEVSDGELQGFRRSVHQVAKFFLR